jgi:hypothetical protein
MAQMSVTARTGKPRPLLHILELTSGFSCKRHGYGILNKIDIKFFVCLHGDKRIIVLFVETPRIFITVCGNTT